VFNDCLIDSTLNRGTSLSLSLDPVLRQAFACSRFGLKLQFRLISTRGSFSHLIRISLQTDYSYSKMAEEARGICVRDVSSTEFIKSYAEHLKNSDKFDLPVWADTVKTGVHKELAPYGDDWYYIRAASIARKVYLRPGIGVGQLQKWYGGAYRRGARRSHFRGPGYHPPVLIQREEMKVVEKVSEDAGVLSDSRFDRIASCRRRG
jgi:small subunit ribosomal protein S19e